MTAYDWEKEDTIDPSTGILLMPGAYGYRCLGNGSFPDYECCCDECDYYLICFPEWDRAGGRAVHKCIKGE